MTLYFFDAIEIWEQFEWGEYSQKTEEGKNQIYQLHFHIWKPRGNILEIPSYLKIIEWNLDFVIGESKKDSNYNYIFLNVLTNKAINFGIPSNSFFEFLWNLLKKKIFQVLFWVLPN